MNICVAMAASERRAAACPDELLSATFEHMNREPQESRPIEGQPSDRDAIARVMRDLYRSISGRADSERDWELCLSLFHPDARVSPDAFEDRVRGVVTEEAFQADARPRIADRPFFEWEVDCDAEITGEVASVRSRYRAAETPGGEPIVKEGVNHLLLIRERGEWRIMAMAW